jgi:hypothetical protein
LFFRPAGGSPDPNPAEDFAVSTTPPATGLNVLAAQAFNLTPGSSEISVIPSLAATTVGSLGRWQLRRRFVLQRRRNLQRGSLSTEGARQP